jgi:hypothetical protein
MWRRISSYSGCSTYIYIFVEKNSTQFHPKFAACNCTVKKIATDSETQRKAFQEKERRFFVLSVAKKLKSKRTGRSFLKADLNDEPDDHEYVEKNCED